MNTLKSVLKHLNKEEKIELSSEVVELSKIDDFSKKVSQFESDNKEVESIVADLDKYKSKFLKLDKKIASDYKKLQDEANDLFKKLNELGLKEEATKVFKLQADTSRFYGSGWNMDAIKFLRS